jgi:hypothetical protein
LEYGCAETAQFFSSRSSGLVGSENDLILDCYQLAKFYHVSPDVFLDMPLSTVYLHLTRSGEMDRRRQLQARSEDDD